MEKNYIKLIIFNVLLIILLLISIFLSIKLTYYNILIFLAVVIALFKIIFGFKNNNHRFDKDIMVELLIIFLSFFLIYYLFGLIIGFVRTENYLTKEGIINFIFPYIVYIIAKEYLRHQIINKIPKLKKLNMFLSFVLFVLLDLIMYIDLKNLNNSSNIFMFMITNLTPTISNNIAACYIATKVSFKVNIFWLMIFSLYGIILPIVPDTGTYVGAMIKFIFPFILIYPVYSYFKKRDKTLNAKVKKNHLKTILIEIPIYLIGIIIIYFTSNLFRFSAIAIASGSMSPGILRGDVVIIDKKINVDELEVGQIIAYKYNSTLVIHRLNKIEKVDNEYFFYSKGDANEGVDDYIIYENMLVGVVKNKISYIGLPTIWISEL